MIISRLCEKKLPPKWWLPIIWINTECNQTKNTTTFFHQIPSDCCAFLFNITLFFGVNLHWSCFLWDFRFAAFRRECLSLKKKKSSLGSSFHREIIKSTGNYQCCAISSPNKFQHGTWKWWCFPKRNILYQEVMLWKCSSSITFTNGPMFLGNNR